MASETNWLKCGVEALCDHLQCWTEETAYLVCSRDGESVDFAVELCLTVAGGGNGLDDQYYTEIFDCYQCFIVRRDEWAKHPELPECPVRNYWIYLPCTDAWYRLSNHDGAPPYVDYDPFGKKWQLNTNREKPCFQWQPENL